MGFAGLNDQSYDEDGQTDSDGFDPIPAGVYRAEIAKAEESTTSSGNACIKVQWKITGPKYANRRVFQTINTGHPKKQVQNIAQRTMKDLGRWNGLEGRYPDSGREMEGWQARIETGFYERDDGSVADTVDKTMSPDGDAAGPFDEQGELYHKAVEQAEDADSPTQGGGADDFDESFDDDDIPF